MVIMQRDLLSELHHPNLDLTSPEHIQPQNAVRLPNLSKENEHMKIAETTPSHYKEAVESMLSGFDYLLFVPRENGLTKNRKFVCKKSLLHQDHHFNKDLRKQHPPLIEEFHNEDNAEVQCLDSEPLPTKCHSTSGISYSEENSNNSKLPEETCVESKTVVDITDSDPEDKAEVKNSSDEVRNCPKNFLGEECVNGTTINAISEVSVLTNDGNSEKSIAEKPSEPFCVISEVIGNANEAFSGASDCQDKTEETIETQFITPQKTTDITKIKGWRRKQFFVEKPTTVEYYSIPKRNFNARKKFEVVNNSEIGTEDGGNAENAFVCDSLDEFLDREADLKIEYEIPHLYAEFGIKLTSDDVVSRPNLSEEAIKEVGTRYCVPVELPSDGTNLEDIKEETCIRMKRPCEEDSKQCKILKLDETISDCEQEIEKLESVEIKEEQNSSDLENVKSNKSKALIHCSNIKLMSKLIALVVYPGPFAPLHPLVQYHLNKLRSYRTKIDKNWAKFAVSAVLLNDKRCNRKVLPAYCCVKFKNSVQPSSGDNLPETDSLPVVTNDKESTRSITQNEQFKLKECRVVIERLDTQKLTGPWCMEHNCYYCVPCGLDKIGPVNSNIETHPKMAPKAHSEEGDEAIIVSPRASFDKNVATLLAKKVRLLKYNGDTLTSIDCLKTLTPNTIEFIKLKFVKESFLTGYISIWFLQPQSTLCRSRAFLTFSQTPPVPNAINLKSTAISQINLPKVLTEIANSENSLDSNEYAILHCNGEIWEIHGSLNIAFGKSDKKIEQIFTSVELPELLKLQEIAYDTLKVKSVKWWVLDLTQKFRLIELKSGNFSTVITRKKFLEAISLNLFGFMPLKKDPENRLLGAYVIQRLLPFVLIGPYYLLESHDLILKGGTTTIPFMYFGEDNVTTNYPLKFFINSVIKNLEINEKKLEGLWLYDKMCLDSTSYLEVVTTSSEVSHSCKYSSIDIEHGYSLNSLTNTSLTGTTSGIVKRKDGKDELKKVIVYLYFDIFDLGYVEGELQFDNSVIISHPLDWQTKMKSHKIGDWFIGIIRRRIQFFPKDLVVRWFVTKHREDLRYRRPFNKAMLGGAHVLTKSGVHYLLDLPESKLEELGVNKDRLNRIKSKCEVLIEVSELKKLSALLSKKNETVKMDEVLNKTISEIKRLKKINTIFRKHRIEALNRKLYLASKFIRLLNSCRIRFHLKIKRIENIVHLFKNEAGILREDFKRKLRACRIGRKYLNRVEKREIALARKAREMKEFMLEKLACAENPKIPKPTPHQIIKPETVRTENVTEENRSPSYMRLTKIGENTGTSAIQVLNTQEYHQMENEEVVTREIGIPSVWTDPYSPGEVDPLDISDQSNTPDCTFQKPSDMIKNNEERIVESEINQMIKTEPIAIKTENLRGSSNGFIKITSPDRPGNIKLFWKNWSVNKLEVV